MLLLSFLLVDTSDLRLFLKAAGSSFFAQHFLTSSTVVTFLVSIEVAFRSVPSHSLV